MNITDAVRARFFAKVAARDKGGCEVWLAHLNADGYGQFWIDGSMQRAHRVAWVIANGAIPEGLQVLHRCDIRRCVNPEHVFLGTHSTNVRDMVDKNRQPKGEHNGGAKLTEGQVVAIRYDPRAQRAIAADYGVAQVTISSIKRGQKWGHVL